MTTSVISHTEIDPNNNPVPSYPVNVRLTTAAGQTGGFRLSDGTGISSVYPLTASTAGAWSVALERSTGITPGGSFYVAEMQIGSTAGGTREVPFVVGTSNQTLYQALLSAIPSYVPPTSVPPSILTGNNIFTGINNFRGNAFFGSGLPWYDVREEQFGAVGNGVADDTAAINAAIAAAQANTNGGLVYFPIGIYLVTGITIDGGSPVYLLGAGGSGQVYSSGAHIRTPTVIKSVTNAPIVNFTDSNKVALENEFSSISNIGILGSTTAGTSQQGLVVDNRGIYASNIQIGQCGSHGLYVIDSVAGKLENVTVDSCAGDGARFDGNAGTGLSPSVTSTTVVNLVAQLNASNGVTVQAASGLTFEGGVFTLNTGAGVVFDTAGGKSALYNMGFGVWIEGNGVSFQVNANGCRYNDFNFSRVDSPPVFLNASERLNEFTYSDQSLIGGAQRRVHQIGAMRSSRGISSTDIDVTVLRNYDDSADGNYRTGSFISTYALNPAATAGTPSIAVPQGVDAFCAPNNRGMTWRNASSTGNIAGVSVSTDDNLVLGVGLASGKGIDIYGALSVKPTAIVFSTAGTAGSAILPSTSLLGFIDVVLPHSTHGRIPVFST